MHEIKFIGFLFLHNGDDLHVCRFQSQIQFAILTQNGFERKRVLLSPTSADDRSSVAAWVVICRWTTSIKLNFTRNKDLNL